MSEAKTYNVLDLFCGAGGLSNGFIKAGFEVLLGIDNDEQALKTYSYNHHGSKTLCADLSTINYEADIKPLLDHKSIDVIIGGPPCQGMSLSGKRSFDDPRNRLYLSFIKLVEQIKPRAFVIENVSGIVSLFKGKIKDSIIEKFNTLGYKVEYKLLCASDFGVPQNRKRVIFVGFKDGEFSFPKKAQHIVTCFEALSDLPSLEDTLGEEVSDYQIKAQGAYQSLMRQNSTRLYNHVASAHSERIKKIIALVPDGGNYKNLPEQYRHTRNFHIAWTRFASNKPSPTIDTGHNHHFHYRYNRVPTVRECARLQSFSDDFIFTGSKTKQLRQVGNAVPPLMAKALAFQIKKTLEGTNRSF